MSETSAAERVSRSEARPRRPRAPDDTREDILRAARALLAKDGPEGISLSQVAKLAGVNRGTAYQHFETREKLIEATTASVSDTMFRAVFGDPETLGERVVGEVDIAAMTSRLAGFAMANPELCRIWLLQILSSREPAADPFWREYAGSLQRFADTDLAADKVDATVLSVITLAGSFLWPLWAKSHSRTDAERDALTERFAHEMLRLSMYGSLNSNRFPEIAERLGHAPAAPRLRAVGS